MPLSNILWSYIPERPKKGQTGQINQKNSYVTANFKIGQNSKLPKMFKTLVPQPVVYTLMYKKCYP